MSALSIVIISWKIEWHFLPNFSETRKSPYLNARGVPPAPHICKYVDVDWPHLKGCPLVKSGGAEGVDRTWTGGTPSTQPG